MIAQNDIVVIRVRIVGCNGDAVIIMVVGSFDYVNVNIDFCFVISFSIIIGCVL